MENNCGICLENRPVTDYNILPCSHKICNICYPKLLKRECPYCRTPFHQEKYNKENILEDITHYQRNYDIIEQRTYERLERRQQRRQRRRERRNNRQRHTNIQQPITVFQFEENSEDEEENKENIKPKKVRNKNNKRSERWNNLRNQRPILNF